MHAWPTRALLFLVSLCLTTAPVFAIKRRPPAGGRLAIVVDERLSALRLTPEFSGVLLRRISRGGYVAITATRTNRDNVVFYKVNLTKRTGGWIQKDAVIVPSRNGEDARLLRLINGSEDFDRIARARIFLESFRTSPLRADVLLILAVAAEDVAARLSQDAGRRLDQREMTAGGAPVFSYFLNYNGLDRYNRQGILFVFDSGQRRFRYDGEAWQELVHRYPNSPQAAEARKRLEAVQNRQ